MFSTKRPESRSLYDKGVYPDDFTEEFKQSIRERDGNRCAVCGHKKKPREKELDVHHINYRKETDRKNCISLCRDCHTIVHKYRFWEWRSMWAEWLWELAVHREGLVRLDTEYKRKRVHEMRELMKAER